MQRIDPTNIAAINDLAHTWLLPGQTLYPVTIHHLVIEEDALAALPELVGQLAGSHARVLMVSDHTPMSRGGGDLKEQVASALRSAGTLHVRRLPEDAQQTLHADVVIAENLARQLAEATVLVSVGSGTVTDLCKHARYLHTQQAGRKLPWICMPTAASVTAFTSAIAVLTRDGVKRNFPGGTPDAVVCDLRSLADAPPRMTQAGFGDVIARSVAYGDWYLAHQLGMDDNFSPVASKLLEPAEQVMMESAESVAARDIRGVQAVTEALLLAGMAMSMVNQTAPISGWEHVISHYLDITAAGDGREQALHGAQVGAATLVVARGYERAWQGLDLEALQRSMDHQRIEALRKRTEKVFAAHDPSGRMSEEIWREFHRKLQKWDAAQARRREFAARKRAGEFEPFLAQAVRSSDAIALAMSRAGAPLRFTELTPPVGEASARAAAQHAHLVRARFTLGDLLDMTDWLTPEHAAGLLA